MRGSLNEMDLERARKIANKGSVVNTEEQKRAAVRALCGARACKDAADARNALEHVGLLEWVMGESA